MNNLIIPCCPWCRCTLDSLCIEGGFYCVKCWCLVVKDGWDLPNGEKIVALVKKIVETAHDHD